MPRTSPRSSEISWVRFQAYSPKRTTRMTKPIGRASKWLASDRMLSQETKANTIETSSSKKKVSRHNSLWRRSNCSRRSETAAPFLFCFMDSLSRAHHYALVAIVGTVLIGRQHREFAVVPDRYLVSSAQNEAGALVSLGGAGNSFWASGGAPQG